jgi:hypothetical protein
MTRLSQAVGNATAPLRFDIMVVVPAESLPSQERQLVRKLKRLRTRSLRNAAWSRDPDHLLVCLSNNPLPTADSSNWPIGSPLAAPLDSAVRVTKQFRSYASSHEGARTTGNDQKADKLWSTVLAAIDALIERAEVIEGRRIPPGR